MTFESFLSQSGPLILADITATKGSTPRETGTFMLVSETGLWGTIGGGNLEFAAIARARGILAGREPQGGMTVTLGPDSGQCCGGVVEVELTRLDQAAIEVLRGRYADEQQRNLDVFVFGCGHVGREPRAGISVSTRRGTPGAGIRELNRLAGFETVNRSPWLRRSFTDRERLPRRDQSHTHQSFRYILRNFSRHEDRANGDRAARTRDFS